MHKYDNRRDIVSRTTQNSARPAPPASASCSVSPCGPLPRRRRASDRKEASATRLGSLTGRPQDPGSWLADAERPAC
jgi:hypothetical protein